MKRLSWILALAMIVIAGCAEVPVSEGVDQSVTVRQVPEGYEISVSLSNLVMIIPKDGFVRKNASFNPHPRYFFFSSDSADSSVVLSGWFEPDGAFPGTKKVWDQQVQGWSRAGLPAPRNISFGKVGNWDCVFYEWDPKGLEKQFAGRNQQNVKAHWVEAGTWIDIHASIMSRMSAAEARSKLVDLLKAIAVTKKS